MYPGCFADAVRSHSQQRLGQLSTLAEGGKVHGMRRNVYLSTKVEAGDNPLKVVSLGIGEATTFRGFCPRHDKELFSCIETKPLTRCDSLQAGTFFLRAVSYEFAQKRRAAQRVRGLLEAEDLVLAPQVASAMKTMLDGYNHALSLDLPYYLDLALRVIEDHDHRQLRSRWAVVPEQLPVSSCCVFSPLGDAHDAWRAEHLDEPQPFVALSVVPTQCDTHVIASWSIDHDSLSMQVVSDIESDLELFVNRAAFAESEDTVFRSTYWEGLTEAQRQSVLHAMRHEAVRGPLSEVPRVVRFDATGLTTACS